jgi:hypothetical protein
MTSPPFEEVLFFFMKRSPSFGERSPSFMTPNHEVANTLFADALVEISGFSFFYPSPRVASVITRSWECCP